MKKSLLTISLFYLTHLLFGQSPEQVALVFYVKEILSKTKKTKVRYDKKIQPIDSSYQESGAVHEK